VTQPPAARARARLGPLRRLPAGVTYLIQRKERGGDYVLRSRFLSVAAVRVAGSSGGGVAPSPALHKDRSWRGFFSQSIYCPARDLQMQVPSIEVAKLGSLCHGSAGV
jgi:hypothetical protein